MDVTMLEALKEMIGTYAFPIVACVAMFIKMNKQDASNQEMLMSMRDAVNNNTNAIERLSDKMNI